MTDKSAKTLEGHTFADLCLLSFKSSIARTSFSICQRRLWLHCRVIALSVETVISTESVQTTGSSMLEGPLLRISGSRVSMQMTGSRLLEGSPLRIFGSRAFLDKVQEQRCYLRLSKSVVMIMCRGEKVLEKQKKGMEGTSMKI